MHSIFGGRIRYNCKNIGDNDPCKVSSAISELTANPVDVDENRKLLAQILEMVAEILDLASGKYQSNERCDMPEMVTMIQERWPELFEGIEEGKDKQD